MKLKPLGRPKFSVSPKYPNRRPRPLYGVAFAMFQRSEWVGEYLEWQGALHKTLGYGYVSTGLNRPELVHRVSYKLNVGPIPDRMLVMHTCDNRKCLNHLHLKLGTHLDNSRDMIAKGRQYTLGRPKRNK